MWGIPRTTRDCCTPWGTWSASGAARTSRCQRAVSWPTVRASRASTYAAPYSPLTKSARSASSLTRTSAGRSTSTDQVRPPRRGPGRGWAWTRCSSASTLGPRGASPRGSSPRRRPCGPSARCVRGCSTSCASACAACFGNSCPARTAGPSGARTCCSSRRCGPTRSWRRTWTAGTCTGRGSLHSPGGRPAAPTRRRASPGACACAGAQGAAPRTARTCSCPRARATSSRAARRAARQSVCRANVRTSGARAAGCTACRRSRTAWSRGRASPSA
mmetsp:Transcript_21671/g.72895  ORF Transcript_21671/g.72895 Transcript_21671/m.72895 type:complete len:274 (-) Transcript_21671:565-1386(-)